MNIWSLIKFLIIFMFNSEMAPVSLHKDTNMSNEVSSEFNLVHKKSDVCEWTDSVS